MNVNSVIVGCNNLYIYKLGHVWCIVQINHFLLIPYLPDLSVTNTGDIKFPMVVDLSVFFVQKV